jgi:putative membrane protein
VRRLSLLHAALIAAVWLGAAGAVSQERPSPTTTPAASPTPAPTRTPAALKQPSARGEVERQRRRDATFMTRARLRGLEEMELSRIAAPKASNPDVHSLALRILEERGKADDALRQLADSRGVELPVALEAEHQAEVDHFSKLPIADIDRAFIAAILKIHEPEVADLQNQAEMGQDVELHAWVYDNLPTLEAEQEEIHRLATELGVPAGPPR